MKTIYVILENADLNEGRGPMKPIGYFLNKEDAEKALKTTYGVMGVGYGEIQEISLYESYDQFKKTNKSRKIR